MSKHTAKSLFDLNVRGAEECLTIYSGASGLSSALHLDWLLRSAIVLAVSAMDAYFHDKVRYKAGKFSLDTLPKQFANLEVPLTELEGWEESRRKGNVLRRWAVAHLAHKSLQTRDAIAGAMRVIGFEAFWDTLEPDKRKRQALLDTMKTIVDRRNQIAHEGDRLRSRRSGKRLRAITLKETTEAVDFIKQFVQKVEERFPS